jgi:hypothetical protein
MYTACLNDFLPSGRGEYRKVGYDFPLPDSVKQFLIRNTHLGDLTETAYDKALRALRLRADFFDDVLVDFENYQTRFRSDVAAMNAFVRGSGLPPLVAIVINQFPRYGGRGHRIAQAAEKHLREGGADVIETEDFYRKHNGLLMKVSQWEGHANELAHYIWATMIARHMTERSDIQAFRRN